MRINFFSILCITITFSIFFIPAKSQNNIYQLKYQEVDDWSTNPPEYSSVKNFQTNQITSDYGKRKGNNSKWHKGVDFADSPEVGDHILALGWGGVEKIKGNGYKIIMTSTITNSINHYFGFGHIFTDEPVGTTGQQKGDMVLIDIGGAQAGEYAILNLTDGTAIAEESYSQIVYNNQTFTTNRYISTDDPIGIIGNSGGIFPVHVHVYMFNDIGIAKVTHKNYFNDRDPLQFISHVNTTYDVAISNDNNINSDRIITSSGSHAISVKVRYTMQNPEQNDSRFNNAVMDVDNVDVFIKSSYQDNEDNTHWGNENSNYQFITGEYVKSHLSHGARLASEIYPVTAAYNHVSNPLHNTVINLVGNTYGDFNNTGIDPFAYSSTNNHPYDDYYFSDFFTRIMKDYQLGGNFGFAACNEEAKYGDGKYYLYSKVTTVRDDVFTSIDNNQEPVEIIIDNFRPFVKKVEIRKLPDSQPVYSRSWFWDGSTYRFEPPPCPSCPDIKINDNLYVKVTTSEPMTDVTMQLNNHSVNNTGNNNEKTEWDFYITTATLIEGENTLEIDGNDLANNPLLKDPSQVPIRQDNGTWLPDPAAFTGTDRNHRFFAFEPAPIDFSATQVGSEDRTVYFEDKSTIPNITSYAWDFGDGISSEGKNVLHTYLYTGTWAVTHTVNNNQSISKNVLVEDLTPPNANFIYSVENSQNRSDDIEVKFYDQSEGIINTRFWTFGEGIEPSNEKNPVRTLEMYKNYDFMLRVTNNAGVSTYYHDNFYYDPATTPNVTIIPWQTVSFYYNIDINVSHLTGPYTYEIDYGDGTSESLNEESLDWVTFNHQYFSWGEYLITAHVTGTNQQGETETVFSAREIEVRGWDLDVQLSYSAPTSPPYPGCQTVTLNANVSGAGNVEYQGTWYIYKIGDPNFYFSQNSESGNTIAPLIYSFPEEGTYKVGFDAVSEYGGHGHGEMKIVVENAPQFIDANFYPLEPIMLGANSSQTFESSVWPIGNPGVPESQWYPTNLRWTLFAPDGTVITPSEGSSNITFNYEEFYFVHAVTYDFQQAGTYKLRLEAWNGTHNYQQDGVLDPACVNTLPYYDYIEKQIVVSDETPYLKVTNPSAPAHTFPDFDANEHNTQIILTNPGTNILTWSAENYAAYGDPNFFEITGTTNTTISSGGTGIISLHITPNNNFDVRYGAIKLTGIDENGNPVQGSPTYVYINQNGTYGPHGQFVYNSNPQKNENFGYASAIDDKYAVVGAVNDNGTGNAYIIERNNIGIWNVVATLQPSDNYHTHFGRSVDIHGRFVIVGAQDKAYIFKQPMNGWSGSVNEITSMQSNGDYGKKVTIWGDWAVVSSPSADNVKIYYRNQGGITDSWGFNKNLSGTQNSSFGYNVDLYNDILAVGAPSTNNGEIRIYNRNHGQANDWGLEHIFTEPSAPSNAFLGGKGFDVYDNKLFYMYRWEPTGPIPNMRGELYKRNSSGDWNEFSGSVIEVSETGNDQINDFIASGAKCCALVPNFNIVYDPGDYSYAYYSKPYDYNGSYFDHLGGTATMYPYYDWAPTDISMGYWNSNSAFGYSLETDFNSVIVGGPNKNSENVNDCGAVYIYDFRIRSLCASGVELNLVNFEKPAGNYPDVSAYKITLGGNGYDAIVEDGATISYYANEITLDDGFLADEGSDFLAEASNCSMKEYKKLPANYIAIDKNSFVAGSVKSLQGVNIQNMLVINLQDIRKVLINKYPNYPWYTVDFFNGIDQIAILDDTYNIVSKIDNPNPLICMFDKKSLPEKYKIIIKIGKITVPVSSVNTSDAKNAIKQND
ncbi:MAG: hypothetical protein DRJ09_02005 [Bacteroidetes bacterium]|nr:MAG: hypothetical protein DRJ09_02005 [Bacteroidota bacterium]